MSAIPTTFRLRSTRSSRLRSKGKFGSGDCPVTTLWCAYKSAATSCVERGYNICMKSLPLLRVVPALVLAATVATSYAAQKETPPPPPSATAVPKTPETADQRLANLKQEVNLTSAQEKKAKPIIEKYVADINANKNDTKATKEEKESKRNALRKQYNDQINAILTPEQQAKWKTAKKDIFEKHASPAPTATPKKH
jgi:Spy/CpxP family protein refolding chaperone